MSKQFKMQVRPTPGVHLGVMPNRARPAGNLLEAMDIKTYAVLLCVRPNWQRQQACRLLVGAQLIHVTSRVKSKSSASRGLSTRHLPTRFPYNSRKSFELPVTKRS